MMLLAATSLALYFWLSIAASALTAADNTYTNPVVHENSPDPGVLAYPGGFVAVTSSGFDIETDIFPVRVSTNLVDWKQVGSVFPVRPGWASAPFYAPEVHAVTFAAKVIYWLVYDATEIATNQMAVGAAWSTSATGPFHDQGAPLIRCSHCLNSSSASAIDSTLWQNKTDGALYILWKNKCDGVRKIVAQQLKPNLPAAAPSLAPTGSPRVVLVATEDWEHHDVEGPFLWQRSAADEWLYLFYSGSNTWFSTYAIGVARAQSIFGPWEKMGPPLAHSSVQNGTNTTFVSPGHNSVAQKVSQSGESRTYLIYHANKWGETGVNCTRYMMVDQISWTQDGWPQLETADGGPSSSPQPVPELAVSWV